MTSYILFDDSRSDLLPLTFTRPVGDIRVGILTIKEKWERHFNASFSFLTEEYLSSKFPCLKSDDNIFINGSIIPDDRLIEAVKNLKKGQFLVQANLVIAARCDKAEADSFTNDIGIVNNAVQYSGDFFKISNLWDIFYHNGEAIDRDFLLVTKGRKSALISTTNNVLGVENIFVEEGAIIECATINATKGPVYIGKDAEIMEGSIVRGPFALCDGAALKMGAKIYGPTTVGPNSKVGGEVNNCVFFANANKAHDGFLGNSVIGEWCNIGADTNTSNLKNNYAEVKLWNYNQQRFVPTGLQFCGLIMGDHSKCGINTMFNTGTVVGVSANIFGAGYPRNFIPSFSWGGPQGISVYPLDKAVETAEKVFQRRAIEMDETERKILEHVFFATEKFRRF